MVATGILSWVVLEALLATWRMIPLNGSVQMLAVLWGACVSSEGSVSSLLCPHLLHNSLTFRTWCLVDLFQPCPTVPYIRGKSQSLLLLGFLCLTDTLLSWVPARWFKLSFLSGMSTDPQETQPASRSPSVQAASPPMSLREANRQVHFLSQWPVGEGKSPFLSGTSNLLVFPWVVSLVFMLRGTSLTPMSSFSPPSFIRNTG